MMMDDDDDDVKSFLKKIWKIHSNVDKASIGDEWFLISSSWLKKWRESSSISGPIENVSLFEDNNTVKKGLVEGKDFEFVNSYMWDQLVEIYGYESKDSPSFIVRERNKKKIVDVRKDETTKKISSSHIDTEKEIKEKILQEMTSESKRTQTTKTSLIRACSVDSPEWRASLTKGDRLDFRISNSEEKWQDAVVVESTSSDLFIHCLGWLNSDSQYYKVKVSRNASSLAPAYTKIRHWRKQLKKEAQIDVHTSIFRNHSKAPCYRSLSKTSTTTTATQRNYYIHYIQVPDSDDFDGEWWLGSRFGEAHGHLYFPTNSLNPLDLKWKSQDECWYFYNEYVKRFIKDPNVYIEQVSFEDAQNYSLLAKHTPSHDVYPRFIRLSGHHDVQRDRCNEIYGLFVPSFEAEWVEATVKRVDHKTGLVNFMYINKNGSKSYIKDVDLYSECLCLHGTHTKNKTSLTGYEEAFRSGPSKFGRGLVGLANLGNTCYMNSMLQCLSACESLVRYVLIPNKLKSEINLKNALGTGGEVATSFSRLMSVIWSGKASRVVPRDFKNKFAQYNSKFAEHMRQQDSMEMFSALMDNLHEDLNRVRNKPCTEPVEDEGKSDDFVAKKAWDVYDFVWGG